MRVFVTGASGYIGQAVAKAFRAKGHTVFGLVRSKASANLLSHDEIWPIIGDMNNPDSYSSIIDQVEVIVHCAADFSDKSVELDTKTIDTILSKLSKNILPKAFIYTSGVWVYGSTNSKIVDEASPLNPIDLAKWRPGNEQKVLKATSPNLRTVVMRPGVVYCKVGGLMNLFFTSTQTGAVTVIGDGSYHWAMIHVQDLAYAYVSAAEKELSNVILNVTNESYVTVREMADAVAQSAGIPGKINSLSHDDAIKQFGPLTQGLTINQQVDNSRIKRLLGWQIHHAPFINEIDIYFNAWKASQETETF